MPLSRDDIDFSTLVKKANQIVSSLKEKVYMGRPLSNGPHLPERSEKGPGRIAARIQPPRPRPAVRSYGIVGELSADVYLPRDP